MQMSGILVFHCSKVYLKVTHGDLLQFYSLQVSFFSSLKTLDGLMFGFFFPKIQYFLTLTPQFQIFVSNC